MYNFHFSISKFFYDIYSFTLWRKSIALSWLYYQKNKKKKFGENCWNYFWKISLKTLNIASQKCITSLKKPGISIFLCKTFVYIPSILNLIGWVLFTSDFNYLTRVESQNHLTIWEINSAPAKSSHKPIEKSCDAFISLSP